MIILSFTSLFVNIYSSLLLTDIYYKLKLNVKTKKTRVLLKFKLGEKLTMLIPMPEDATQEKLDAFVNRFSSITTADLTDEAKEEMRICLEQIAAECHGYTMHFDIEISPVENFFYKMQSVMKKWLEENKFDQQALRTIAGIVINLYLQAEGSRKFDFLDIIHKRWTRHTDNYHFFCCEISAGNFLSELGFHESALHYYYHALRTAGSEPPTARNQAKEAMRKLAADYRKSGQQITALEEMIDRQVSEIVDNAKRKVRNEKWIDMSGPNPLRNAQKLLSEMGFDEPDQNRLLRPAFEMAISAFVNQRNEYIGKRGCEPEKCCYRTTELAELCQIIGDEKSSLEWMKVFLSIRRSDLEEGTYGANPKMLEEVKKQLLEVEANLARLSRNLEEE